MVDLAPFIVISSSGKVRSGLFCSLVDLFSILTTIEIIFLHVYRELGVVCNKHHGMVTVSACLSNVETWFTRVGIVSTFFLREPEVFM